MPARAFKWQFEEKHLNLEQQSFFFRSEKLNIIYFHGETKLLSIEKQI